MEMKKTDSLQNGCKRLLLQYMYLGLELRYFARRQTDSRSYFVLDLSITKLSGSQTCIKDYSHDHKCMYTHFFCLWVLLVISQEDEQIHCVIFHTL
jgi:hypothetical protein